MFFGYDTDKLLTCASPTTCLPPGPDALKVARSIPTGAVTTTHGNITETWTYNTYGELASQTATYGTTPLANFTYDTASFPRDAAGRIKRKSESFNGGAAATFDYAYDTLGRLTTAHKGSVLVDNFTYDGNGNRKSDSLTSTTQTIFTDAQDRLTTYNAWTYTHGPNGELKTRVNATETHTYTYDTLGNLTAVALPGAIQLAYVIDGKNRRVGKKRNGTLVKQWLYRDQLSPVAELDATGAVTARLVYASRKNIPDYVVKGTNTYRLISDQLGSPRIAVNINNASDIPYRADYSTFGVQTMVTGAADWIPFGFAGGLNDPETKLVRFGARDYEPATGRWTAKDPIRFEGGQANVYAYVDSDPINSVDSTGLSKFDKLYGLSKKFWRWYHRNVKQPGDPDLQKDEAEQLCKEWQDLGKPGPDKKGPRGNGGWEDLFDWIIPLPDFIDPCSIDPTLSFCDKSGQAI